jgi:hypothetical protein
LFAAYNFLFYIYTGGNKFTSYIVGCNTDIGLKAVAVPVAVLIQLSNLYHRHMLNEWAQYSTDANLPHYHLPRNEYDMDGPADPADPDRRVKGGSVLN